MLHEILLSLSGVHSPALRQIGNGKPGTQPEQQQYVSDSERAMLSELAHLSLLHFEIKKAASTAQTDHASPICRAVGSSILDKQLGLFRRKIIDVETSILRRDSSHVGGYDVVPLSTITTEFSPWTRRLEWLRKISNVMLKGESEQMACSGAGLLQILERETHTGYVDIEQMASGLLLVGETSWMRLVSSWLLYGTIPEKDHQDFMIRSTQAAVLIDEHVLVPNLVPFFVTQKCAENILNTGSALNQIRQQRGSSGAGASSDIAMKMLPRQLDLLKLVQFPLAASILEATIGDMNALVSQNALSQLLPLHKILEVTSMIQSYLLLGRGEFAISLINNVEERLHAREKAQTATAPVRKLGLLDALDLKDTELGPVLAKTWSDLAALQSELESEDQAFMLARQLLRLNILKKHEKPDSDVLISTLAPSVTLLRIDISINSPLRMFISDQDMAKYSHINAHLLSIRRCQMKLANLWKLTSHRRCHPSPLAPPASASESGKRILAHRRERERVRALSTRRHWSSMSRILFMINELGAYLQGEIIQNSWGHFQKWLTQDHEVRPASSESVGDVQGPNHGTSNPKSNMKSHLQPRAKDPRVMAHAHQQYLNSLYSALFIDQLKFNKSLSALLTLVDHFSALFGRLQTVWQGLDLQEDDGIVDAFINYAQDEKNILAEMSRSGTNVEQTLTELVTHIKEIERDRNVNEVMVGVASIGLSTDADGRFVPWRARTLDRLIMKLDFLQGSSQDMEELTEGDE